MAGRNIIWCQTSDAATLAQVQGKKYSHVILSALHMHNDGGTYSVYLNDMAIGSVGSAYWTAVSNLQKAGITVTALVGGAGNGTWQCVVDDPGQATSVLSALTQAPYNLQGFDLDWETSPSYSPTVMADFTNRLATAKAGTIVTHAPVPSLLSTYDKTFWNRVGANLAWLNVQWYGDSNLVNDYYDFVSGKTSGTPVAANRVVAGATVKTQPGVGYTDLCQLMRIVVTIQGKPGCSGFGGVAGWEFTQTIGSTNPKVANWDTCIAAALAGQTKCVACS